MSFSNRVEIVPGQGELTSGRMCPFVSLEAFEEIVFPSPFASITIHCLLTDGCLKAQLSFQAQGGLSQGTWSRLPHTWK